MSTTNHTNDLIIANIVADVLAQETPFMTPEKGTVYVVTISDFSSKDDIVEKLADRAVAAYSDTVNGAVALIDQLLKKDYSHILTRDECRHLQTHRYLDLPRPNIDFEGQSRTTFFIDETHNCL